MTQEMTMRALMGTRRDPDIRTFNSAPEIVTGPLGASFIDA